MEFAISKIFGFLENRFFLDVDTTSLYLPPLPITRIIKIFIGVFILKKLGKINILKDKGKGFGCGILMGSIPLVFFTFFVARDILAAADIRLGSLEVIVSTIFMCFSVGVIEEIYFRGIIFNVIDGYFGHKNAHDVWKTVVLDFCLDFII